MRRPLGLLLTVVCTFGCKPKAPTPLMVTKGVGYQVTWDPRDFRAVEATQAPRLTQAENGTDIPFDVAPARAKFTLHAQPPRYYVQGEKAPTDATYGLQFIPLQDPSVPDFAQAYPDVVGEVEGLKDLLRTRPTQVKFGTSIPEWTCIDTEQTLHAKVQYLETPWCSGVFFLTQHTQEAGTPISNQGLIASFQGLSRDGKVLVEITLPVSHPSLTGKIGDLIPEDQIQARYREIETRLTQASDDSFSPPLGRLRALIQSLGPKTP